MCQAKCNQALNADFKHGIGYPLDKLQVTSESALHKRQVRKAVSYQIAEKLYELESPLKRQYERSLNCGQYVKLLSDGTYQSWYCGKRWCTVCSAIKQAELIEGYLPSLQAMGAPYLVTLTIPSVKAEALKGTIRTMPKVFAKIKDSARKKGFPISGIRKIECNYNQAADTFNPHYHILVNGEIEARYLHSEWLKRVQGTKSIAQDIQVADRVSLKELFKYQSKVIVGKKFNAKATDTILQALNGIRTIQPFGTVKKARLKFDKDSGQVVTLSDTDKPVESNSEAYTVDVYTWHPHYSVWLNDSGEPLLHTSLSEAHQDILKLIRDG